MKSQQNQWELVAEQLIRDIRRGTYKSGEKVPSENEMAGRFGVPRSDIRKAYSCLKELGYLRSSRGCGSFVAPQRDKIPLSMNSTSFSHKMLCLGLPYESKVIQRDWLAEAPAIRQALALPAGGAVLKIARLRLLDGRPAALHTSYLPGCRFPHLQQDLPTLTSVSTYIRQAGYTCIRDGSCTLQVEVPSPCEREWLEIPGFGTAVILTAKQMDEKSHTPIELMRIVYRADRFTFLF